MAAPTRSSVFLPTWLWVSITFAALMITTIETQAWTTPTTIATTTRRSGLSTDEMTPTAATATSAASAATTTGRSSTRLFGKKKNKSAGGASATKGAAKIQVKLLQHIAGTGQAGDVILVNPVFFANKLRPQKLARVITDEEVKEDLENKKNKSDDLREKARAVRELLDDTPSDDDSSWSSYVLIFKDNQTGPDGKKLFGGIGPKKLMEALRKDYKEFDEFSKEFTKQVSILDVEEQEIVEDESSSSGEETKYKDYSSSGNNDDDEQKPIVKYSSLPKKDKLTIKNTGVYRMKVALTKDMFARVRVIVE